MYHSSDCGTCLTIPVCCYSLRPLVNNCFYSIHFSWDNRYGNHCFVLPWNYCCDIVVPSMVMIIFHAFFNWFILSYTEPQKKHHIIWSNWWQAQVLSLDRYHSKPWCMVPPMSLYTWCMHQHSVHHVFTRTLSCN